MRYGMLTALALLAPGMGRPADSTDAVLRNANGADVGKVTVKENNKQIEIIVTVSGLPAGTHGMHLHAAGRCEAPDFQSAGGHLNPGGTMQHGHQNPKGPHLGDLGNLTVGEDQKGSASVTLSGNHADQGLEHFLGLGQSGVALVIHAGADDEKTDPSGSSGARIACAVLQ